MPQSDAEANRLMEEQRLGRDYEDDSLVTEDDYDDCQESEIEILLR